MWEGDEEPQATADDVIAGRVFSMLSNGHGGIDWPGLPLAVALFGVRDIEALIHRLLVIKTHRPDREQEKP